MKNKIAEVGLLWAAVFVLLQYVLPGAAFVVVWWSVAVMLDSYGLLP